MKQLLSKILAPFIICSASATSLLATQETFANEEYQPHTHTSYISYEICQDGQGIPSLGYRYQKDEYIFDISVGYKYLFFLDSSLDITSISSNVLYSFFGQEKSQSYAGIGIGATLTNSPDFSHVRTHIGFPIITVGHEFKLDRNRRLFIDLMYKPYAFENIYGGKAPQSSIKIGIGF